MIDLQEFNYDEFEKLKLDSDDEDGISV